jgi:hypothetical protein
MLHPVPVRYSSGHQPPSSAPRPSRSGGVARSREEPTQARRIFLREVSYVVDVGGARRDPSLSSQPFSQCERQWSSSQPLCWRRPPLCHPPLSRHLAPLARTSTPDQGPSNGRGTVAVGGVCGSCQLPVRALGRLPSVHSASRSSHEEMTEPRASASRLGLFPFQALSRARCQISRSDTPNSHAYTPTSRSTFRAPASPRSNRCTCVGEDPSNTARSSSVNPACSRSSRHTAPTALRTSTERPYARRRLGSSRSP